MEIFNLFFFIISDRKILDRFIRSYYRIDKEMEKENSPSEGNLKINERAYGAIL